MSELVSTGVEGLDSILTGGITERSTVLVSGNPGTGKSIFGIQYLYHGVTEHDERGVYVSFEEDEADIRGAAESIGLEGFGDLVDSGDIVILDKRDAARDRFLDGSRQAARHDRRWRVRSAGPRLAIDVPALLRRRTGEADVPAEVLGHPQGQRADLAAHQRAGRGVPRHRGRLENFLTDGNIYFIQTPTDSGVNRYVWVAKMRKQDIDTDIFPMEIGEGGITVHERAGGFSMMGRSEEPSF